MLRIKKLDIFVIKSFVLLFIGTTFICLFIFMMQFLWKRVDDMVGKGLDLIVLAKFFYYSALALWPTSAPLAVLLASLMTFGNFGERFELIAMKAAGIPLTKVMRPLIIFTTFIAALSFYFQNVTGPNAQLKLYTLIYSMTQTSPELDIPESSFYQLGEENKGVKYNLYVRQKDKKTGMLYNVMIYNFSDGFENAHIIVADSGRLETTADKKHLYLHLYNGEQFENLRQQSSMSQNVPYRRESFVSKHTLIDFDSNFSMQDGSFLTVNPEFKGIKKLNHDIDSLNLRYDSIGRGYYDDAMQRAYATVELTRFDSTQMKTDALTRLNMDSLLSVSSRSTLEQVYTEAKRKVEMTDSDLSIKSLTMKDGNNIIRRHWVEMNKKFTLSLACIIFFFIGAPLGAIIRKGGLGMPVVVSIIIFLIYYIINSMGERAAKNGSWEIWFGTWISTFVTLPLGIFFTYKATRDSGVFNADVYMATIRKLLGIRTQRHLFKKEVIIEDPDYRRIDTDLDALCAECEDYMRTHRLDRLPNYARLFTNNEKDTRIRELSNRLETLVEELANSKDHMMLRIASTYPVLITDAHTSPFSNRWLNMLVGLVVPVGLFFYIRVWRFGLRLNKDLRQIITTSRNLQERIRSEELN
uniref:LptF/LptG family permease n=1 Tax=Phocaeicola sp. TaxID=2773926 RepID=UPI003FF00B5B